MSRKLSFGSTLLAATVCTFLCASLVQADDDAALNEVRAKMTAMFESVDAENINSSPVDGWYTIQQGPIVAYVSGDGRYLLQGDLIDLDTQVNLTEISRNNSRRELVAAMDDDHAILFSPSDVKYSITVFTDVDCTYCRKLHSEINEYLDKGIEVRYLLYPRNGPASKAWTTSENVWCADNRNQALTAAKLGRGFESSECDASVVGDHYGLGRNIGLSGTPAIVLEDGTLIGGYVPPAALSMRLEQNAAK
ncbi:MAG: DsbC family protein [Gammaproteobacteria bacterium]|nr:DsbC family protein [Gammaproteobacteria bacterium]MBU2678128.1 DsbC family protein [Gammaproteobacteria bacterium]NNL51863.1 DsbC family protein [Woeseiaceae bacterium]